ncbi:MAG: SpoIVB peptidase [Clostridia bacterium]|nr:SpoIVB peptidase [Clostridia bacterium]
MRIKKCTAPLKAALVFALVWYIGTVAAAPSKITLWQNEAHSVVFAKGVVLRDLPKEVQLAGGTMSSSSLGEYEAKLSLFGIIPYKSVSINVVPQTSVAVCGNLIGIRLHSDGLIVVGTGSFVSESGQTVSPGEDANILAGDVILTANGEKLRDTSALSEIVQKSEGEIVLSVYRNGENKSINVMPSCCGSDKRKKLGVWVRDSAAGVGTITYIDTQTNKYGALGHSISDTDTGIRFDVLRGTIEECDVLSIKKGERGAPGEIHGAFKSSASKIGSIEKNTENGIYGTIFEIPNTAALMPIALANQIRCGEASIFSMVDDAVKEYSIKILRISHHNGDSRAILFEVTDDTLLQKAGGIVQGMSGSPIVQDGAIVGAVTHVLVNEPDKGYGVLIETMLNECG